MKKNTAYHDFIVYDLMSRLFEITSRPMMSGWCIYLNKVPFAAIIGNQLYLKAVGDFGEKLSSMGWVKYNYKKTDGKTVHMNYWQVPDELINDPQAFEEIVKEGII